MHDKEQIDPERKLAAVKEYLAGDISLNKVSTKYGVNRSSFMKWLSNYRQFGEDGLRHREKNQRYPEDLKRRAVETYLTGYLTEDEVYERYGIRCRNQLQFWLKVYNSHKEFWRPGGRRMNSVVTKKESVNRNRQLEVVTYCLNHSNDYSKTAVKYGVTYQQVYSWVNRYRAAGSDELHGGIKRRSITEEQLKAENKKLLLRIQEFELTQAIQEKVSEYALSVTFSGVCQEAEYMAVKWLLEEKGWKVCRLCAAAGICRAAYYKWLHREPSKKQLRNERLAELIQSIYKSQRGVPGYRQMTVILRRRYKIHCNKKCVHRIMKLLGLSSVCRRKKNNRIKKTSAEYTAENILARDFSAVRQNEKWLTDITELKYGGGKKAYLSAVLDLYGKNIVAFSIGHRNDTALVFETFKQALEINPNAKPLLHSDRGCQYTSKAFRSMISESEITQSMSRPGKCIDNGPMESFWSFLKTEMYYLIRFDNYDTLCAAVSDYIYFYNNERYQANLGCMTPAEFIAVSTE